MQSGNFCKSGEDVAVVTLGSLIWKLITNSGVFMGVFSRWCVAREDAGRAAYSQLHLQITGEYNH